MMNNRLAILLMMPNPSLINFWSAIQGKSR